MGGLAGEPELGPRRCTATAASPASTSATRTFRFNNFFSQYIDANFQNGDPTDVGRRSRRRSVAAERGVGLLHAARSATRSSRARFYAGLQHVWRTTGQRRQPGVPRGQLPRVHDARRPARLRRLRRARRSVGQRWPGTPGDLTSTHYGSDKRSDPPRLRRVDRPLGQRQRTMWAAHGGAACSSRKTPTLASTGAVTFTRLDSLSTATPRRFVSGIAIDPDNPNHAYVSFGGYNAATTAHAGARVRRDLHPTPARRPGRRSTTARGRWATCRSTSLALDEVTGRLYAATDFGVVSQLGRSGFWATAAAGLPAVEVSGLTIDRRVVCSTPRHTAARSGR